MKAFFRRLGETWTIIGITLLLLFFVELFFRLYLSFNPFVDKRVQADSYGDEDWVSAYFKEYAASSKLHWESYTYWKREPFDGEFIRIDENGYRATVTKSHPLSQKQKPVTIFFLGGSSIWGTGVRDAFTIPSLTGNELIINGFNPTIVNMGESGYVSSQDLQKLIKELKAGNIPDLVVFYGGLNDIYSSFQAGKAGIPQNEIHRKLEFNTLREKKKSIMAFLRSLRTLSTVQFISSKFEWGDPVMRKEIEFEVELLAEKTAHQYNENIRLVNALAKEYGFHAIFYWQPSLFDKPFRTDYEKSQLDPVLPLKPFLEAVNSLLFSEDLAYEHIHFFNLSNLFMSVREPIFIDWCHTGEAGNLMISKKMAKDLLPLTDSLNASREPINE